MGIESINEPGQGRTTMLTPASINEPPTLEEPVISAIAPDQCTIGQPDFTLFISGEGFSALSVIFFAGHDEPTTLNEDGTLSTGIKPSLWQSPVVVQCQVRNGDKLSNAVDFTFAAEGAPEAEIVDTDDPDELEDEIEQAKEEGDFKPTHPHRRKKR
jgi:hypothetical protein